MFLSRSPLFFQTFQQKANSCLPSERSETIFFWPELDFCKCVLLCFPQFIWHWKIYVSSPTPYLSELDFSNSPVWNIEFDELDFFPSLKPTGYFFQFKLIFFSSFMARVKYFDRPCLTIYSLSTIYRDIHYQFLVWWIHYSHCYEPKR